MQLYQNNGTNQWRLSWQKEMRNFQVNFYVKYQEEVAPIGYQEIVRLPIIDIKATMLTWKVHFVAYGHTMNTPADMSYAQVVSQEIVQIALLIAILKDLGVLSTDVHNTYLNASPNNKYWFKSVPEFVQYEGHVVIIVQALYGME